MKKLIFIMLMSVLSVSAQPPAAFNYQAVARNAAGNILSNAAIAIRVNILDNPGGTILYSERHTATTNQFGLFDAKIGMGTVLSGTFGGIAWINGSKYLQVELDPSGGTSYADMGTSQLLSVPYALYSGGGNNISGTQNYVLKFTGSSSAGNSLIYDDGTSVGIGTSSPSHRLDIAGGVVQVQTGGYIRVGPLDQSSDNFAYYSSAGQATSTGIKFETSQTGNQNGVVQMTLLSNGNVGIGTSTPSGKLDLQQGSGTGVAWGSGLNIYDGPNRWELIEDGVGARQRNAAGGGFSWYNAAGTKLLMQLTDTGNLAITSAASVAPSIYAEATGYGATAVYANSTGSDAVAVYGSAATGGTQERAGYFSGKLEYTGSLIGPSDLMLKKNIVTMNSSLSKLMLLQPKQYEFKTDEFKSLNLDKGKHYGLISQDIQKVFPDLVMMTSNHPMRDPKTGNTPELIEYLAVNYMELIPITISAIQEQQQQIEELKNQNALLKARLDKLENK